MLEKFSFGFLWIWNDILELLQIDHINIDVPNSFFFFFVFVFVLAVKLNWIPLNWCGTVNQFLFCNVKLSKFEIYQMYFCSIWIP